ncbi:hypothetical protein QUF88_19540 [Bacillus sp. DX1.1]|uniref:hypothetical protein n=1 Tax=unclassified Bacillus (in: firmicutes) TaxID=185979 RepID=UPI00257123A6|nr:MULTISPECIES: hypothetical protein [unclassified Bacillus (in: firmicutes)]MDM5155906.1 hypothetical protein [Bacillus sp. DX1.1]WJE80200.1 hypothetical protein QRE67_17070 [Bacillus sp. DX3.1]
MFQAAIKNGEVAPKNPLLLAHSFSAVTIISNKHSLMEQLGGPEKVAEELVDLFWLGISPKQ